MKIRRLTNLMMMAFLTIALASSCVKEGPMGLEGPAGKDGDDGKDGKDANETCKMCHAANEVDLISTQFQFSKHKYGEAAFEEAGRNDCTPCHAQEAFKYVVKNNIPSTFTLSATTNRYVNNYATIASAAYGEIGCSTCHDDLHTTYGSADLAFTTTAPVSMSMWGGGKTIDLKADGGVSNLCVKCHQPRPFTASNSDGNVLDYKGIADNPTAVFFDPDRSNTLNKLKPGYRSHPHYGTAGAIYAGVGGVEFSGTMAYTNSKHTTDASCKDCHMGSGMVGRAGGHTFFAAGNLTTCNTAGCHSSAVTSTSTTLWLNPRNEIKTLLSTLGGKLKINGVEILNRNPNATEGAQAILDGKIVNLGINLWASTTTEKWDGYLNIYDPLTNPMGATNNLGGVLQNPSPSTSWTAEQKAFNLTLQKVVLTNAQMGAIINFQLVLRDYSLGIHNFQYAKALLTNSIAKL